MQGAAWPSIVPAVAGGRHKGKIHKEQGAEKKTHASRIFEYLIDEGSKLIYSIQTEEAPEGGNLPGRSAKKSMTSIWGFAVVAMTTLLVSGVGRHREDFFVHTEHKMTLPSGSSGSPMNVHT